MLLGLWVTVLLGHAKINDMNNIGSFGAWSANEEIVGLDIAVNEVLLVDCLDAGQLRMVSIDRGGAGVKGF